MVQRQGEQRCGNQTTMPQAPEAVLALLYLGLHDGEFAW